MKLKTKERVKLFWYGVILCVVFFAMGYVPINQDTYMDYTAETEEPELNLPDEEEPAVKLSTLERAMALMESED